MATASLKVHGRVQGVFYRQSMQRKAQELGVSGWVRNAYDGTVEAQVSGPREAVDKLINWSKDGPPAARVDNVDVEWNEEDADANGGKFEIH